MCLVYGAGQQALEMAQYLARTLSVTLLLSDQDDLVLPQPVRHSHFTAATLKPCPVPLAVFR